jgi:hypothetical protein
MLLLRLIQHSRTKAPIRPLRDVRVEPANGFYCCFSFSPHPDLQTEAYSGTLLLTNNTNKSIFCW